MPVKIPLSKASIVTIAYCVDPKTVGSIRELFQEFILQPYQPTICTTPVVSLRCLAFSYSVRGNSEVDRLRRSRMDLYIHVAQHTKSRWCQTTRRPCLVTPSCILRHGQSGRCGVVLFRFVQPCLKEWW